MAHWAELDEKNVVLRVTVGDNSDPDEGYDWLVDNLGGRWVKTSYNDQHGNRPDGSPAKKGTYAGEGYTYDETNDRFVPPRPFPSWVWNEDQYRWDAPIASPEIPTVQIDERTVQAASVDWDEDAGEFVLTPVDWEVDTGDGAASA